MTVIHLYRGGFAYVVAWCIDQQSCLVNRPFAKCFIGLGKLPSGGLTLENVEECVLLYLLQVEQSVLYCELLLRPQAQYNDVVDIIYSDHCVLTLYTAC